MFCGECGHRWAPDEIATARFCAECGAPREDLPASASSSSVTTPVVPPAAVAAPTPAPVRAPSFNAAAVTHPAAGASMPVASYVPSPGLASSPSPSIGLSSAASGVCSKCFVPFSDPTAAFCGECGHPKPVARSGSSLGTGSASFARSSSSMSSSAAPSNVVDDGSTDLFGVASTPSTNPASSYSPYSPPMNPSASAVSTAPLSYSMPAPAASTTSMGSATPASISYQPPMSTPLSGPVATGSPQMAASTAFETPPASVTLLPKGPLSTNISDMLSHLSVKPSEERAEPDGDGIGVVIQNVTRARNMDSLSTRLEISAAVERNKVNPMETVDGYHVTKANDFITVVHNANMDPIEEKYYDERSLPDNGEWQQLLRRNRQSGTKFTDPQFPPDSSSLFRDANNKKFPHLEENIWRWKRLSEFFNETAYVEITMLDDAKKLVCSIAIKSPAEAESILDVIRMNQSSVDASFLDIAKRAVTFGLSKRKREHMLLLTTNMITHLSEKDHLGVQRFDQLWEKSLLEHYKPLKFTGVGNGTGYRVDSGDPRVLSKVSVLVPIYFQAEGTCIFDRSREHRFACPQTGVGIEPGEICQGRLADSYLFGALSILSTSPNALSQLFPSIDDDLIKRDQVELASVYPREQQYNEEGVYAVRFWRNNRSRVVVIDDFIPCSRSGKPVFGSFTGSNGKFEVWSLLVEKAYAKLHGGYEAIIGGQEAICLQDLWGGVPADFKLPSTEDAAWERIRSELQSGSLLGCMNDDIQLDLPSGLRKSVAYGIMKLVEIQYQGAAARLIQLRNSFGRTPLGDGNINGKWRGAWSSSDERWKSMSRIQKVECGFQFRDDATIWMDFSAFYCFFNTVILSKNLYNFKSVPDGLGNPVAPTLSIHLISGEWSGVTSGGREAMHLNPQYQLFCPVAKGCQLTVHLEQPSRRMSMMTEYPYYVAPIVLKNGESRQRKIDLSSDVLSLGTFISNRSCLLEVALDQDPNVDANRPFVVIPATYEGNLARMSYYMTLFTSKPTAIVPISDTGSLPICCVCQRALVGSFRTFTHDGVTDRVCKEPCASIYKERTTPLCAECSQRIEQVEGHFSGRMYTLSDGVCVHAECVDAYRIRRAEKCAHCGQAITPIPGRFEGKYFDLSGLKIHAECMESYQLSKAKRCLHCSEPIMEVAGKFSGKFYKIADSVNDDQVHFECWEAYQQAKAPKCVHCHEAIMKIVGRFDGRFYELNNGAGKVHFECWDAYRGVK